MTITPFTRLALLAGAVFSSAVTSLAGQRPFTYLYETTTAPKGSFELETWATWKHRDVDGGGKDVDNFEFRHEVEIGLTDRLQLGIYLYDWAYSQESDGSHEADWQHSGFDLIYNMTNPTTSFLGSALYGEIVVGRDSIEIEGKLLLEKQFGPLTVAYNAVLEAEWEGETLREEKKGEFKQLIGVSYELNKHFSVGAEALHEIEFPEWEEANDSVVYAGPNVSVRAGRIFATATALFQVTDVEGEADFQVRLITGIQF